MTKSNNEWVSERFNTRNMPDVGSVVAFKEYSHIDRDKNFQTGDECEVLAYKKRADSGQIVLVVWNNRNNEVDYFLPEMFTEIKTEAEKRRESLVNSMIEDLQKNYAGYNLNALESLAKEGWCKPKPLTNSVTLELWKESDNGSRLYEFAKAIEAYIRGEG